MEKHKNIESHNKSYISAKKKPFDKTKKTFSVSLRPVKLSTEMNTRLSLPDHPACVIPARIQPIPKKPFLMLQFLRLLRSNKIPYSTMLHEISLKTPFHYSSVRFLPFGECSITHYKRKIGSDVDIIRFTTFVSCPRELIGKFVKFNLLSKKDAENIEFPVKYLTR